jgi:hypothetical protein
MALAVHLRCTCSPAITTPTVCRAHLEFVHVLYLSIRSRCGRGWASLAPSAPVVTPQTRGEIRPYYNRNSPMVRDESMKTAIEMAAERPTSALLGVCTHVRLSSFAWRRQGMSPGMLPAPPAQGLVFSRAPQVGTKWTGSHSTLGSNSQYVVPRLARFANSSAGVFGNLHVLCGSSI